MPDQSNQQFSAIAAGLTNPELPQSLPSAAHQLWLTAKELHGAPIDGERLQRLEAMPSHYPTAPAGEAALGEVAAGLERARPAISKAVEEARPKHDARRAGFLTRFLPHHPGGDAA
ncbi:hypothetical protein CEW88_15475 [Alloyangia pacifica]|uniref:Uncharacterized protein n=1 Tax=Alloyangia pacifica TaxID=311180 RepID=A0A2U8HHQ9_9RHOB|nr:hypothetical protein [Alloyangia pacifica]AWI85150.1 hypothetical protein CEW88_15475 [Alloyangia pacifica]